MPDEITWKCFNCGAPIAVLVDGVFEDKECCYRCFVNVFNRGEKKKDE